MLIKRIKAGNYTKEANQNDDVLASIASAVSTLSFFFAHNVI